MKNKYEDLQNKLWVPAWDRTKNVDNGHIGVTFSRPIAIWCTKIDHYFKDDML